MKSKSDIIMLMIKLGVICVVVSGLLAVVNSVTSPIIAANDQKNFEQSMKEVMPGNTFEKMDIDFSPKEEGVKLESVYKADGGFAVTTVCSEGYGGDVKVMVGVNDDLTVNRVKIISMSETAGLGARASEEEYYGQYNGLKSGIGVEKNKGGKPENNTISAISGATITSKAVTKAVNCALEAAEAGGAAR